MKGPRSTGNLLLLLLLLSSDPGTALPLPLSTPCCTQLYRKPLTHKLLKKVTRVELQEVDGDCHLQAFVLYLHERSVCIHPENHSLGQWFQHHGRKFQGTLPNLNFGPLRKMGWVPQKPK
ncbi:C-C motif chemokine 27 [Tamandua tetradactyla]|uniref:C-C motif chemokine 27 n=1 Tax=Tamandua tetradactyla TaxID=48850 RepID=UPI004053AF16